MQLPPTGPLEQGRAPPSRLPVPADPSRSAEGGRPHRPGRGGGHQLRQLRAVGEREDQGGGSSPRWHRRRLPHRRGPFPPPLRLAPGSVHPGDWSPGFPAQPTLATQGAAGAAPDQGRSRPVPTTHRGGVSPLRRRTLVPRRPLRHAVGPAPLRRHPGVDHAGEQPASSPGRSGTDSPAPLRQRAVRRQPLRGPHPGRRCPDPL